MVFDVLSKAGSAPSGRFVTCDRMRERRTSILWVSASPLRGNGHWSIQVVLDASIN